MLDWKYSTAHNRVILTKGEPRAKLKVTGTRFATILGFNDWSTPFEAWCEITKLAKKPFEDTQYTLAGKAIEPKVIEYCKKIVSPHTKSPQEWFGNLYSNMRFDFFPENKIYGGMWDAIVTNGKGDKIRSIIEIKTTKRVEDWLEHPPVYYLLQACLYAYLEGVNQVIMVASFLEDGDYAHPENFEPSEANTKMYMYNLDELSFTVEGKNYSFNELVGMATEWYNYHVKSAESPEFDEKADAEILKIVRTTKPENDNDTDEIIAQLNEHTAMLQDIMDAHPEIDALEKSIKALKDALKKKLEPQMGDSVKLEYSGWVLSRNKDTHTANVKQLEADGLTDYITVKKGALVLKKMK